MTLCIVCLPIGLFAKTGKTFSLKTTNEIESSIQMLEIPIDLFFDLAFLIIRLTSPAFYDDHPSMT